MAQIASRTPEGASNCCPVCHSRVCIEPSRPAGNAPCPNCGVLLWFLPTSEGLSLYETEAEASIRERITDMIYDVLAVNKEQVDRQTSFIEEDAKASGTAHHITVI
jgi:acyl carrier protein